MSGSAIASGIILSFLHISFMSLSIICLSAPLGDPVEVTVRGYELSLRKADAEMIEVE